MGLIFQRESEARILQRCKKKLNSIKANIYSYMLTPRDAFNRVNGFFKAFSYMK